MNTKEYNRNWRLKNRDRINKKRSEYGKKWRKENPEKAKELFSKQRKKRYENLKDRYGAYKRNAKRKNLNFNLSIEEFNKLSGGRCEYCNDEIKVIGIDRINNKIGYIKSNVVRCCSVCNRMKLIMNVEQFINQCSKVYENKKTKKE